MSGFSSSTSASSAALWGDRNANYYRSSAQGAPAAAAATTTTTTTTTTTASTSTMITPQPSKQPQHHYPPQRPPPHHTQQQQHPPQNNNTNNNTNHEQNNHVLIMDALRKELRAQTEALLDLQLTVQTIEAEKQHALAQMQRAHDQHMEQLQVRIVKQQQEQQELEQIQQQERIKQPPQTLQIPQKLQPKQPQAPAPRSMTTSSSTSKTTAAATRSSFPPPLQTWINATNAIAIHQQQKRTSPNHHSPVPQPGVPPLPLPLPPSPTVQVDTSNHKSHTIHPRKTSLLLLNLIHDRYLRYYDTNHDSVDDTTPTSSPPHVQAMIRMLLQQQQQHTHSQQHKENNDKNHTEDKDEEHEILHYLVDQIVSISMHRIMTRSDENRLILCWSTLADALATVSPLGRERFVRPFISLSTTTTTTTRRKRKTTTCIHSIVNTSTGESVPVVELLPQTIDPSSSSSNPNSILDDRRYRLFVERLQQTILLWNVRLLPSPPVPDDLNKLLDNEDHMDSDLEDVDDNDIPMMMMTIRSALFVLHQIIMLHHHHPLHNYVQVFLPHSWTWPKNTQNTITTKNENITRRKASQNVHSNMSSLPSSSSSLLESWEEAAALVIRRFDCKARRRLTESTLSVKTSAATQTHRTEEGKEPPPPRPASSSRPITTTTLDVQPPLQRHPATGSVLSWMAATLPLFMLAAGKSFSSASSSTSFSISSSNRNRSTADAADWRRLLAVVLDVLEVVVLPALTSRRVRVSDKNENTTHENHLNDEYEQQQQQQHQRNPSVLCSYSTKEAAAMVPYVNLAVECVSFFHFLVQLNPMTSAVFVSESDPSQLITNGGRGKGGRVAILLRLAMPTTRSSTTEWDRAHSAIALAVELLYTLSIRREERDVYETTVLQSSSTSSSLMISLERRLILTTIQFFHQLLTQVQLERRWKVTAEQSSSSSSHSRRPSDSSFSRQPAQPFSSSSLSPSMSFAQLLSPCLHVFVTACSLLLHSTSKLRSLDDDDDDDEASPMIDTDDDDNNNNLAHDQESKKTVSPAATMLRVQLDELTADENCELESLEYHLSH